MSEKFSTAIRLADLNDFIAPSQSCVVNLNGAKRKDTSSSAREVKPPEKLAQGFNQASAKEVGPVKVTLHDCLACSGCITSAETIMLEQQSCSEFLSKVEEGEKTIIVSLSPQSRASLASYYGITPLQAMAKMTTFMKSLGVKAVFDTSCSRDLSLIENCAEFIDRYMSSDKQSSSSVIAATNGRMKITTVQGPTTNSNTGSLPMISSACPGWVCYAEKMHGTYVLPYISRTKSPQQVMGSIIKRYAGTKMGLRPEDIYHVTVMPCFDKKLEASRDDFIFAVERQGESSGNVEEAGPLQVTEVDCVLTSGEVLDLLQSKGVDFANLPESPVDQMLSNVDESGHLYGVRGGSGGYLQCVFRKAARELFGKEIGGGEVQMKILRNTDLREVSLEVKGKKVLNFLLAYGFRNIQNVLRKIKAGKCDYHFIEIMACPSGCLNGGGQVKPRKGQSPKELIQELESLYLQEVDVREPDENPVVQGLYEDWLERPYSEKARQFMHTEYHLREKSVGLQLTNW